MQVDVEENLKGEDSDGKQGNDYEENNNSEDSNYEKYSNDDEGGNNENELFAHEYFERIDRESKNKTPGYFPSRVCYIRIYDLNWCSCWFCDVVKRVILHFISIVDPKAVPRRILLQEMETFSLAISWPPYRGSTIAVSLFTEVSMAQITYTNP